MADFRFARVATLISVLLFAATGALAVALIRPGYPDSTGASSTGSGDETTRPVLASTYVERLKARGIDAAFELVPDAGHVDILGSSSLASATARLVRR